MKRYRNTKCNGLSQGPEYNSWSSMIKRCTNPNNKSFHNYGGRGIKVCERWLDFNNFYKDMHDSHRNNLTLERIDNNGDYEPSNCRWITKKQQAYNRRTNVYLTYLGITRTLTEWNILLGLKRGVLYKRLKTMSLEKAIQKPPLRAA